MMRLGPRCSIARFPFSPQVIVAQIAHIDTTIIRAANSDPDWACSKVSYIPLRQGEPITHTYSDTPPTACLQPVDQRPSHGTLIFYNHNAVKYAAINTCFCPYNDRL